MALKPIEVLEAGITGVQDDNTPEGIVRVKVAQGELVCIPAASLNPSPNNLGSGSISVSDAMYSNIDGSGSSVNFSTPNGIGSNRSGAGFSISGRVIGVRYRRNTATPPFTVIIDGTPYNIYPQQLNNYINNILNVAVLDRETFVIIADDLEDITHSVEIVLQPSTSDRTLVLYGFLAEKRVGYTSRTPSDFAIDQGELTASNVAISNVSPPSPAAVEVYSRGIKKIFYFNSDATARVVTLTFGTRVIWQKTIPSGLSDVAEISNSGLMGGGGNLKHKADAAAVVSYTVISSL